MTKKTKDGREIVEMVGPGGRRCFDIDDVRRQYHKGFRFTDKADETAYLKQWRDREAPTQTAPKPAPQEIQLDPAKAASKATDSKK